MFDKIDKSLLKSVTSSKFYTDSKNIVVDPNGLLSENIFGPLIDYRCVCGKLNSRIYDGKTCKSCGVICASSDMRFVTFAKIESTYPFIKPSKFKNLNKLVGKNNKQLLNPILSEYSKTKILYLNYETFTLDSVFINNKIHAPICITGIFTLYTSLRIIYDYYLKEGIKIPGELKEYLDCFDFEFLVIPPQLRLSTKGDKNGKNTLIISRIDEEYRNILYLVKDIKLTFSLTDIILSGIARMGVDDIEPITEDIFNELELITSKIQYRIKNIYDLVSESIQGKNGIIRFNYLGKTIDFSGRSVVIPDTSLKTYEIKISKRNFIKFWFIEYLKFLKDIKGKPIHKLVKTVKFSEVNHNNIDYLDCVDDFIEYYFNPKNVNPKNRLLIINRQPTLWRFNIVSALVVGLNETNVISVSPNVIAPFNMDFDGDSVLGDVTFLINNKEVTCHISEFMNHIYRYTEINPGILYKILDDVKIKSINMNTNDISYNKITDFSVHKNLNLWKIKHKYNKYSEFSVSEDHSLVLYNKTTKSLERRSILEVYKNFENYCFVSEENE